MNKLSTKGTRKTVQINEIPTYTGSNFKESMYFMLIAIRGKKGKCVNEVHNENNTGNINGNITVRGVTFLTNYYNYN